MEIVCISDTHGQHQKVLVPPGDILIHAGDITDTGSKHEVWSFLEWFSQQPYKHKIFIAGNHDFYLENLSLESFREMLPENVHYLKETGIKINGILFWGSPVVPGTKSWAFSETSIPRLREHWGKIPKNVDFLITHSPPYGIMDQTDDKLFLGSKILRKTVAEIKPTYHVFGHLHDNYGKVEKDGTTFVNATTFNSYNKLVNPPIKLTMD